MKTLAATCFTLFLLVSVLPQIALAQGHRGVMISPSVTASDLQYLGETWKANLVRWQLFWTTSNGTPVQDATQEEYDAWLEGALKKLDSLLPVCERYGIKVVVDLHTTPGGRDSGTRQNRIFSSAAEQARFIQVWNKLVARYAASGAVWGYDLANEPVEGAVTPGLMNWQQLATQVATNIRKVDGTRAIIVAASKNNNLSAADFVTLPASIPNVVYTVHMYQPWDFTSQGISPNTKSFRYPGIVNGRIWDKAKLKQVLQPVVDLQRRTGAPIYVGEFSAVRWAAGGSAYPYLRDVIDIFESYGWDWTYHAFREYHGWSVEHTEDKNNNNRSPRQTNREKLLRTWFSKNSR